LRCLRDAGMPIAYAAVRELARGGDETITERISLLEERDRAPEKVAHLRAQQEHSRVKIC
jgi:hypothetical protein